MQYTCRSVSPSQRKTVFPAFLELVGHCVTDISSLGIRTQNKAVKSWYVSFLISLSYLCTESEQLAQWNYRVAQTLSHNLRTAKENNLIHESEINHFADKPLK